MFDWLKNTLLNQNRYKTHSEAVIVACFYNPQNSPCRLLAFWHWYKSIKHLNHRIIECLIGPDANSQLPKSESIQQVHADTLLWHKETLLNRVIAELPPKYQYVFWLDTDILFTNLNWLADGVTALQKASIIQPFEYCIHLEKNQLKPNFDVDDFRFLCSIPASRHPKMWRSFCANYCTGNLANNLNYDVHGHVGFAWGARREVLDKCPLYDRALIGGADHIIAHAAANQVPHACITNSFAKNLEDVLEWSIEFSSLIKGMGYVEGDLYHIWHGDIRKRQYLQRIKDFTGTSNLQKDKYGFYTTDNNNAAYVRRYYQQREVAPVCIDDCDFTLGFAEDMGYALADVVRLFSQQSYATQEESPPPDWQPFQAELQGTPPVDTGETTVPNIGNYVAPADIPEPVTADTVSSNYTGSTFS